MVGLVTMNFGLIDKIAGEGIKIKLALEIAVWPLALTVIGPVLAPAGTVVTRLEVVAGEDRCRCAVERDCIERGRRIESLTLDRHRGAYSALRWSEVQDSQRRRRGNRAAGDFSRLPTAS